MAKKTAKKPAAKTTTNRPAKKITRGAKKQGSRQAAGVMPKISAFPGAGKTGRAVGRPNPGGTSNYAQRAVKLFTAGNRKKPTMMAARKGQQTFLDKKGRKTTMDKASTKGGNLRKGFQMVTSLSGGRNKTVVTGGSSE